MRVDHEHVQSQCFNQFLQAVSQHAHIVAFAQHASSSSAHDALNGGSWRGESHRAGDVARFHAGRDEENPPADVRSQARGYIMSGFFDVANGACLSRLS